MSLTHYRVKKGGVLATIRHIARTKAVLNGSEHFEGQDDAGSFKAPVSALASTVQSVTIIMTTDELNHLNSEPITAIEAPGEGFVIVPFSVMWVYHAGSIPFPGDAVTLIYGSDPDNPIATAQNTFGQDTSQIDIAEIAGGFNYADAVNQPVTIATQDDFIGFGEIISSGVSEGGAGAGYAGGDTGDVDGGATYTVDTVDEDGAVLSYHLTSNGAGYAVGQWTTSTGGDQPGEGTGLTIDVLEINPGDGTGAVTILYKILDP